jgi:hypothetical protein
MTLGLPYGTWRFYYGSASGQTTTALPASGNGTLASVLGGILNSLSGGVTTVTLDPRTVPAS